MKGRARSATGRGRHPPVSREAGRVRGSQPAVGHGCRRGRGDLEPSRPAPRVPASHRRPDAPAAPHHRRRQRLRRRHRDDAARRLPRRRRGDAARTNTGGAGGFALGLDAALDGPVDARVADGRRHGSRADRAGGAGGRAGTHRRPVPAVVASPGRLDRRPRPPDEHATAQARLRADEREAAARVGCVPIRSASFVSILVDADGVRERGLPVADYFLWNDDFEFTTRLIRGRRGLFCPRPVVVHKTKAFAGTEPTRATASSSRFATSSGCYAARAASTPGRRCCTPAPPCAAGCARSPRPRTASAGAGARPWRPCGPDTRPTPTDEVLKAAVGEGPEADRAG